MSNDDKSDLYMGLGMGAFFFLAFAGAALLGWSASCSKQRDVEQGPPAVERKAE